MSWPAIEGFRKWTVKRKKLLQGLLGLAVEGVADCVPGGALAFWATRVVGEVAKHGVERLADTTASVPDIKPAGQPFLAEQFEQLDSWLASLSTSYASLLDRLDGLVMLRDDEADEQLPSVVRQMLSQHAELARDFDAHTNEVRRQTRSLARIETVVVGIDAKVDRLSEQIAELAQRNHIQSIPTRPPYSVTINSPREQALARRFLEEFRNLPPEFQRVPDLSRLGDILRAAGLFQEAKESYAGAAKQTDDRAIRAANHYKAYLIALEQRQWEEGLAVLTEAASLDEAHYAPFPLRQYQPKRILGAGGFGTAFLCRDRYMKREVVVKSLHHAELERGMEEVFAEAHTLLVLSREHPSIIGVQHCGYADAAETRPYIVMDYFPGSSLQVYLEQLGPKAALPLEDFLPIARQIAAAMQAAHGQGVLHRDLKPDNILVRNDEGEWQVKVIDFGLAVRTRVVQVSTSLPARERTLYGDSAAGTARYASPEQMGELPGIKVGPYSDVYAFGKLCCYALFRDTEPKRRQWGSIPEELAEMLEGCIEKELEHRHRNFEPVLAVLTMLEPTRQTDTEGQRWEKEDRRQAEMEQQRQAREDEERRQQQKQIRQAEIERQRQEEDASRQAEAERQRNEEEARKGVELDFSRIKTAARHQPGSQAYYITSWVCLQPVGKPFSIARLVRELNPWLKKNNIPDPKTPGLMQVSCNRVSGHLDSLLDRFGGITTKCESGQYTYTGK